MAHYALILLVILGIFTVRKHGFRFFSRVLAMVLLFLCGFLFTRAWLLSPHQLQPGQALKLNIETQKLTERLALALKFQTISHQDPQKDRPENFQDFHSYLKNSFPLTFAKLQLQEFPRYSLLLKWQGASDLPPILLLAHQDVVPVPDETQNEWKHPPFSGTIQDGWIWGRGAMDDKSSVLGILEAVEILLSLKFQPQQSVYLAFGGDEEVGGQGARAIAQSLQEQGLRFLSILDEGMVISDGILSGPQRPIALIGLAEKGYASVDLLAKAEGGHSSMPTRRTAIGLLSEALFRLETHPMPARILSPTSEMFGALAAEMGMGQRLALSNLWLFEPLVVSMLSAKPASNAILRTTTAPTLLQAGTKENVLATEARATVNFRIHPADSVEAVLEHVRRHVQDLDVEVQLRDRRFASEPSAISPANGEAFRVLQQSIRTVFPEVATAPALVVGATDARHYAQLSDNVYRFLPLILGPEDTHRIHGINERISLENYRRTVEFYAQYLFDASEGEFQSGPVEKGLE